MKRDRIQEKRVEQNSVNVSFYGNQDSKLLSIKNVCVNPGLRKKYSAVDTMICFRLSRAFFFHPFVYVLNKDL